jgi:hypothetical protein
VPPPASTLVRSEAGEIPGRPAPAEVLLRAAVAREDEESTIPRYRKRYEQRYEWRACRDIGPRVAQSDVAAGKVKWCALGLGQALLELLVPILVVSVICAVPMLSRAEQMVSMSPNCSASFMARSPQSSVVARLPTIM